MPERGFAKFDLGGRKAVVTGGSAGLGYAMARGLLKSGATVLIAGRGAEQLAKAADELAAAGDAGTVLYRTVDLYDRASVDAFAAGAIADLGGVDIFLGNAGAVHAELLDDITAAETDRCLQLNLTSNIALTQAFVPHMRTQGWGRIIFSSSTAANLAAPFRANITYAASKAGINAFARAAAGDLGRQGITVNVLILGVFWTSILRSALAELRAAHGAGPGEKLVDQFETMTALGRLGDPAELEGIIQLLASDAGAYITGAAIPLDGGTSITMLPHISLV